jgi:hypothetical protein
MKSKSESSSSSSSSPKKSFCDSATTSSPIDEETISSSLVIKTEEVPSSSNNITPNVSCSSSSVNAVDVDSIRVKKQEEEVDDDDNNHDDGTNTNTSTSNMNCDLNRSVKKEEELDNNDDDGTNTTYKEIAIRDQFGNDYDYSDWKTGDWCWLLPADENTQQLTSRSVKSDDGGNNTSASTVVASDYNNMDPHDCEKSEESHDANTATAINGSARRLTRQCRSINDEDDGSAEASRPRKKKRTNGDFSSANNNYNTTKQKEEGIQEKESHKNTVVSTATVDDVVVDVNSSNDDVDYNENLFKESNSNYEGDGYESWTEGNWCLLLPPPHSEKIETEQQSHDLPSTERGTIRSRRRRRRRRLSFSAHVDVGDENENELDEDYAENDDDDDNNDNSRRTKAGKTTIRYTIRQNEIWNEMYQRLVAYEKQQKSTIVPQSYKTDPRLGNWVTIQRAYYKNKNLSIERTNQLESIGFVWDPFGEKWMEYFHKLVGYKKQYRSTKVPRHYTEDPQLGRWVRWQRYCYRENKLTEKRTELLNSIGFVWAGRNFSDR